MSKVQSKPLFVLSQIILQTLDKLKLSAKDQQCVLLNDELLFIHEIMKFHDNIVFEAC